MSMTWGQFTAQPNGKPVINQSNECVAIANQYHGQVIGGSFVPVNSAHQWWNEFARFPQLTANYNQSATPAPGAIAVWRGGRYNRLHGHIGTVTQVSGNGTYNTIEQNAESNRWLYRYTRDMANVLGFLIPKNNPAGDDDVVTQQDKQDIAELVAETLRHYQREGGRGPDGSYGRTLFDLGQQSADGLTDTRGSSIQHLFQHNLREYGYGWQDAAKNGKTVWEYLRQIVAEQAALRAALSNASTGVIDPKLIEQAAKAGAKAALTESGLTPQTIAKTVNDDTARRMQS